MPMYDRICPNDHRLIDCWEPLTPPDVKCPECGEPTKRAWWLTKPSNVISDECDVVINNGICNLDGTPRHYRFKSEMRRVARERGLVNYVEHSGTRDSDKSKHTTRWI